MTVRLAPSLVEPRAIASRIAWQKLWLVFCLAASVMLLMIGRNYPIATETLRTTAADLARPLLQLATQPASAVHSLKDNIAQWLNTHTENHRLREENTRLKLWYEHARQLESENQSLHTLLNVPPATPRSFITAPVIGDASGALGHSAVLGAGKGAGIRKGQAVLGSNGLVGKIMESGNFTARILLLTDINSRIPVMGETSLQRGILAGDNSLFPKINYLPRAHTLTAGERIVTSGDGGFLPPGIPVGIVTADSHSDTIRIQPFAGWESMRHVQVMDFDTE